MIPSPLSRRQLLATAGLTVVMAGCVGEPRGSDSPTSTVSDADEPSETTVTEAASGASTTTVPTDATANDSPDPSGATTESTDTERMTAEEALDLREANVVGVEFDSTERSYRFRVTLYHDDDGEDGYADWWQVETLDGEQLGRRTLLHAHSTAPFTRSETITVPEGTAYVVVRGHDQTHGYGGQAMIVAIDTGETETVQQGPEPRDFSGYDPRV